MYKSKKVYDCIIVGGGIAGLMAAIYLARFNCQFKIIDNNQSRAKLIPKSHNFPGCPNGIIGTTLLNKMRQQLNNFNVKITKETVYFVKMHKPYFKVTTKRNVFLSKFVIIATGVQDIEPDLPNLKKTIKKGLIRHCLICDGYEARGKRIAILGKDVRAINEAILLATYSNDITVFIPRNVQLSNPQINMISQRRIKIVKESIEALKLNNKKIYFFKTKGGIFEFDTVYSALGIITRNGPIKNLPLKMRENCILVNQENETTIPNLYAIGDITSGLHQMSVAIGQAAKASVSIFKRLQEGK